MNDRIIPASLGQAALTLSELAFTNDIPESLLPPAESKYPVTHMLMAMVSEEFRGLHDTTGYPESNDVFKNINQIFPNAIVKSIQTRISHQLYTSYPQHDPAMGGNIRVLASRVAYAIIKSISSSLDLLNLMTPPGGYSLNANLFSSWDHVSTTPRYSNYPRSAHAASAGIILRDLTGKIRGDLGIKWRSMWAVGVTSNYSSLNEMAALTRFGVVGAPSTDDIAGIVFNQSAKQLPKVTGRPIPDSERFLTYFNNGLSKPAGLKDKVEAFDFADIASISISEFGVSISSKMYVKSELTRISLAMLAQIYGSEGLKAIPPQYLLYTLDDPAVSRERLDYSIWLDEVLTDFINKDDDEATGFFEFVSAVNPSAERDIVKLKDVLANGQDASLLIALVSENTEEIKKWSVNANNGEYTVILALIGYLVDDIITRYANNLTEEELLKKISSALFDDGHFNIRPTDAVNYSTNFDHSAYVGINVDKHAPKSLLFSILSPNS